MNRAQRYIFSQLLWWTIFVAICLTCVVWLTQSLRFVEMIVSRGASASVFLYLTLLLLPTFLSLILPIAMFTAVMFTYTKMSADSELIVLRASGLSPLGLAQPALVLAALFTLVGFALTTFFIPASYREFKELQFHLRNSYSTILLQEGVFNPIMKGVTVYVRARTSDGQLLGIIVHDNRDPKKPMTMMAERGAIVGGKNGPRVVMANGNRQQVDSADGRLQLLYFDSYTFELSGLVESPDTRWREPRERYLHELFFPLATADEIWNFQKLRMEGHHRMVSPLLGPAFVIIGLAFLLTGSFSRHGQMKRVVAAVMAVVAVESMVLAIKSLGEKSPDIAPLIYLCVLAPVVIGGYTLASDRRWLRRISRTAPAT